MRKLVAIKVEFEALGLDHIAYTTQIDFDYINSAIQMVHHTAHLTAVSSDVITAHEYEQNCLELIVESHKKYKDEYQ